MNHLENIRLNARFPKEEDFHGAAQAVIRLQDTYELNMTQLAKGILIEKQTRAGMMDLCLINSSSKSREAAIEFKLTITKCLSL